MDTRHPPVRFSQRLISWIVCGLMVWQPVAPAVAAALTPAGQTTVDRAGNGVPVVNIATPNGAGISHNQFGEYNVGSEGLILNNGTDRLTRTQLGGLIQNNPNLQAGREATGIINEVTGASRSQLQGYTEVAGKAANVMVANPYGITCNGCGFINTPNVTLTTGKPQFDASGNLLALEVTKGAITVEGQGLDASKSDALSIIARATEVNAAIHANDLTVTAGANRVGADGSVRPVAGEGAAPVVAVDTGALGGMYANRIRLVSSEAGVGVNLGNLTARQGDIQLDAGGKLTVRNSLASGSISAKGAGVALSGSHQAGGALNVASSQDVELSNSTLASQGDMRLSAAGKVQMTGGGTNSAGALAVSSGQAMTLSNTSLISRGAATLNSQDTLTVNGGGVSAQGGALTVAGGQGVALSDATLTGQGDTTLSTGGSLTQRGGSVTGRGALSVAAGKDITLTNTRSGSDTRATLSSGGTLSSTGSAVSAGESLALSGGQLVLDGQSRADAAADIRLTGSTVSNQGQVNAGRDIALSGDRVSSSGLLAAKGRLDVNAGELTNGGTAQGSDVTLKGQTVTNSGTLQSAGSLTLSAGTLAQRGTLSAKGNADVTAQQTLRNDGSLLADGAMNVTAGVLEQNGTLSGATALTAQAGTLTSGQASRTTSQGNIQITATRSASLNGQTDAAGAVTVSAGDLTTGRDAHLQSGQGLTLQAQNAALNGTQAAKGALSVTAGTIAHAGKSTGDALSFNATGDLTSGGELTAGAITLSGQNILQSGAAKADRMTLTAPGRITSSGSLVAGILSLDAASVENGGLLQGTTLLGLKTGSLANLAGGSVYSAQDLTLNVPVLTNGGLITTDGTLRIKGDTLTNQGEINGVSLSSDYLSLTSSGRLLADDRLTLNGTTLVNAGSIAAGDLHITANSLENQGTVEGDAALTLGVADLTNRGALRSGGTLTLNGDTLTSSGELSATALLLNLTRQVSNEAGGRVIARDGLTLTAASLTNSGLMAGADAQFNSASVTNGGTLQGTHSLTAAGAQLSNLQAGMLLSGGALGLHHTTLNNAGLMQGSTLNLATGEWMNTGNALGEAGVTAAVTGALTNSGKVLSQQALDVQAGNTDNRGQLLAKVLTLRGDLQNSGLLQGSSTLAWSGNTFANQTQGQVTGGETLTLSGHTLSNAGSLQGRSATLDAAGLNNQGSVQALDALTLAATGRLDNTGALLSQNLFTLTAAQLFNDGRLAGKALTVNAAQLTNTGMLQGNDTLALTTRALSNGATGQLVSGSGLNLSLDTLDNAGLLLVNGGLTLRGSDLTNRGDIQAQDLDLGLGNALSNTGNIVATGDAALHATTLTSSGTVAGRTLTAGATELRNSGLMQGSSAVNAAADRFINALNGKWLSGGGFTLTGGQLTNAGTLQGATLDMTGTTLTSSGTVNGLTGLSGTLGGALTNTGLLQSGGATTFTADTLANPGRITGGTLSLTAREMNNDGLMQGTNGLALTGTALTTGAASRTLSGGMLTLDAGQLTTQGTLQGNGADVRATGDWTHGGSLLSQGALTAATGGTLTSSGSLMSQGRADITAQTLDNRGQLLSEGDVTLGGSTLKNSGTVQGNTLALRQDSINNQGTLTGLQSLTVQGQQRLMARMAMAAPQQALINGAGGRLLTQGALTIASGAVTNAGSWQAQNILLNAQSLSNSGTVQSADGLQMTLADALTGTTGSKITALGSATLQAATLANQGQWAAKNLTLTGGTLSNSGAISGVNGLTLSQTGAVSQQSTGTLLSGGALNVTAASVTSDGKMQGSTLGITTGALTNGGRLQGDNGATLALSGTLINSSGGEIVSRDGLTLTTPALFNYGLIQGGGETRVTASSQARNDGRLLSGARLTLGTPQFTGTGWLQATDLILNAANATNGGTWVADRATLTGTTFASQGTTQAGQLTVNYGQLNNSGTLLGNAQLNIGADQVTQSAGGRLLSGGNLWLQSRGLDLTGQLVSLGDLTLQLTNAFTSRTAVAAGRTLTISSGGDIDNRSVLQGQAVNLSAGGQLSNNGQITTGGGTSTLSGSSVALNAAGSVQGGGDITVASRSNITVDGFTGTRGSLTLSAPGSIVNTALLYAANNLALFADSITNRRGDIMAGNNLWMQRDAAGNANSQVVNTSGNIETQNGDITIRTGSLLNEREGISETRSYQAATGSPAASGATSIRVKVTDLPPDEWGYIYTIYSGAGGGNIFSIVAPMPSGAVQRYLVGSTVVDVTATGGVARIAANHDLTINAATLNNRAGYLLAGNGMNLSGNSLNNQSWFGYSEDEYKVYRYSGKTGKVSSLKGSPASGNDNNRRVTYTLDGAPQYETHTTEQALRAVIQAGGQVTANFTSNISNTATTSNGGGISHSIPAPSLNTLSNQSVGSGVQKQGLNTTGTVAVNSPQWNDRLQGALQQLNGGGALENGGASGTPLSNVATTQKGNANLGQLGTLANAGVTTADLRTAQGGAVGHYQGQRVDTSAYPLPSGNNGYFVFSDNPKSPYLIGINPKLNGLGQLDPALFADLNAMLGIKPSSTAPQETRLAFTDEKQFLGSSYMLGRLNLNPDYDYRFLGDAAFDTRYVSNVVLNQTGNRYLNGIGSDLDQMRYLMDNAAAAQQSLGLQFGVSLTADQIAALDHSLLWWEKATVNGETVMVPKLYLSPKDVTVNNGSVIAGNNVTLKGGSITNGGSTLLAKNSLTLDSQNSISNLNSGLMKAGGDLNLSAIGDINNISSTISGKTVALESLDGSINNLTQVEQIDINAGGKYGNIGLKDTLLGNTASITAQDGLSLEVGKNITVTGANLASGGDMLLNAWGDIAVNANQINDAFSSSREKTSRSSVTYQGSNVSAGGNLLVNAGHNLDVTASDLKAGGSAGLSAGNDLNLNAAQTSESSRKGKSESHSTGLDRTTISAGDNLVLKAGQDINARAAALAAEKSVGLQAGRDVNLAAAETTQGDSYKSGRKKVINESVRQSGTDITAGGNVTVIAGRDVTAQAADVYAAGDTAVAAGRDITLSTATESDYAYREEKKTSGGFLSKKTTHTIHEETHTREKGTQLSGDNVALRAGNNLTVQGSSVAAERDVALKAGNDLTVEAATNTDTFYDMKKTKKSGVFSSGSGLGITIGSQSSKSTRQGANTTQSDARSTVGTAGGNVIISAGNDVQLSAADVVAGRAKDDSSRKTGHIDITGDSIAILPGRDTTTESMKQESKSSGVTVSVKAPFEDTVRNVRDIVRGKGNSGNSIVDKVKGLGAEGGALALDGPGQMMAISAGSTRSSSESHYEGEFNSGSHLAAAGNIQMTATGKQGGSNSGNILIAGSQAKAGETVILDAKRDVDITTSTDSEKYGSSTKNSGWNLSSDLSAGSAVLAISGGGSHGNQLLPGGMSKAESNSSGTRTTQNASVIQGSDIYVNSRDGSVNISGSLMTATDDLLLSATNGGISVSAGRDTSRSESSGSSKLLGTLGGDGYSATAGYRHEKNSSREDSSLENGLRSQLSSKNGSVVAQAGNDLSLSGTDIRAGKSVSLSGENVLMGVSRDTRDGENHSSSAQYGVTASAGGWAVEAAKAAETAARSAENGDDPRLTAIRTGQSAATAAQGAMSDSSLIKAKVSLTAGASSQDSRYHSTDTQGTTINAGENVSVRAGNDIAGMGVQIAGKHVALDAGRDILLSASQNTTHSESKNSGSQFSVGVGVSLIGAQNGISVELGASQHKGKENSQSQRNTNSVVHADEQLTVNSGRDTTLKGVELEGNRVVVNTGRDLTISSVQDTASYDSRQSSSGASLSLCIPPLCYGASSGSVSASGENITQNGKSVAEQSGIFAGKGGFAVTTGNHTQLDGAVIASTASADKNSLDTGTLGFSNLHNESQTSGNGYTVALSGSAGGSGNGENRNLAPAIGTGLAEESHTGTTSSAVSGGSIVIRNPAGQKQDIADLSRDTADAHHGVDVNGDVQKVRDNLAVQSEGAALATSALDAYGKYAEQKARESNAALGAKLASEGKLQGDTPQEQEAFLKTQPGYQNTEYGPGSAFWTKGSAAAGLLAGALGGNLKAGAAAGAAPLLATLVKEQKDPTARAALHGIVAAALTQLSGGSTADGLKAGAIGAITASAMTDHLVSALYGDKKSSDLTPEEKRLVSSLVSIAGGLAGAAVTDGSVSMAAMASETAKVEVENNSLSVVIQGGKLAAQGCLKISACRDRLVASGLGALLGIGASTSAMDTLSQDEQLHLIYVASLNDPSQLSQLNDAQKAAYESLTGKTITSTGGTQVINPGPSNTGGDQTVTGNVPSNTGNNSVATGGINHTGNTNGDGASNNNGWTTTTPIPDSPSLDDLFYQNEKIPGLENVRPENPGYPANQSVIEKMNEPKFIAWIGNTDCTDCSDIAPKLLDAAGGHGKIIEARPTTPYNLNVYENGKIVHEQAFHQVYTDGQYVYDPRVSLKPIPKGDWEKHIKSINQGSVTISDKLQGLK
ncbi:hemagglutinin repeat-containing protein [Enterobacter asburiae]|uniref:Hemagglutinin repeat-containing protein n=10 Tax=Enterobacter asburiae TaxID=61645 RepID=A0A7W3C5K6_ENTAS|nr:hemagglutinin repeat-containing protein [Enterobacter asburiae]MBA7984632.1 hemagglutinin repeat-containing protein [Enterobacter asburiae]MBA8079244.1 hemagglutinin repeat-containing protein [Enterobacter asburiae]